MGERALVQEMKGQPLDKANVKALHNFGVYLGSQDAADDFGIGIDVLNTVNFGGQHSIMVQQFSGRALLVLWWYFIMSC